MIYIYDRTIEPYETTIRRYGATYTLEKVTRMGEQKFFSFVSSGREKILVVPRFAEQYFQAEKIFDKFKNCKKLETCINHIKRGFNRYVVVEEFPNEDSETGIMIMITVDYMDIRLQFQFMNNELSLYPEFEILNNNIFGNGVVVTMNLNMEDEI